MSTNMKNMGPHGLGDPDDKFLRKVELDILIPQKMRDKAKEEKCADVCKEFKGCCKESGLLMVVKCQEVNTRMKDCLTKWYNNPEFRQQCTEEYLKERSEYRSTGISQKRRLLMAAEANSVSS